MKTAALISLIGSLTKGEKRNFKILANKSGKKDKLYILLFDWLEKKKTLDNNALVAKHPQIKVLQIPNLKNILYKQILRSLREINKDYFKEIQAREQFDFAKILYSKGAYKDCLHFLQKAKKLAKELHNSSLIYLALDFEKQIESQHITGSMSQRAKELSLQSRKIIEEIGLTDQLSNLSLLLYGLYLKKGFVRNNYDGKILSNFFINNKPVIGNRELDFRQKLYLYQSYVWYYYMFQDAVNNFRYARKWVELFEQHEEMKAIDTAIYLKGLHNVLSSLFIANKKKRFLEYLKKLKSIEHDDSVYWNFNERSLFSLFKYIHGINAIFLTNQYHSASNLVNELESTLAKGTHGWDKSRLMVFYYKLACIHFGNRDYSKTLFWLNKIINGSYGELKQDVQCFTRVLSLITHYELGNDLFVSNQIIGVYRFLLRMKELGEVQRAIFHFLRRTTRTSRFALKPEFEALKNQLIVISADRYERRAFLFLDLISWLDSKLLDITMVEAIQRRM